jgi:hypothetical protein
MKNLFLLIMIFCFGNISFLVAQNLVTDSTKPATPVVSKDKEALKFNLNDSGTHFFQATFLNQTWLRFNDNNAGSLVDGDAQSQTFDIGLRRTRIQMFGQITDKVFVYFQFGQNNFNAQYNYPNGNRKSAAFFHDAVGEYKVSKGNELKLGAGLTIANGLSRFSQPSIGTIMTMDVPVFLQSTVDQTDEFSRKLSVYARGQVGRIDYRVAFSDPFPINSNGQTVTVTRPTSTNATFSQKGHTHQLQAYVMYQFFEHENHTTPYMTGTYLGKKKIFNIAGGVISQQKAMWYKDVTQPDSIGFSPMFHWGVESFLDMPLNKEKGTAISAFVGYYQFDYGTNYLRFNGIMNSSTSFSAPAGSTAVAGNAFGNAFPMFGTGNSIYGQIGFLLPEKWLKQGRLMPYASIMHSQYDRLQGKSMDVMNVGMNWLIKGHNSKITLDYQNRPTYTQNITQDIQVSGRKGAVTMQYQIFF